VAVPAGKHQVEVRYFTPGLKAGLIAALVALLVTAVLVFFDLRRKAA